MLTAHAIVSCDHSVNLSIKFDLKQIWIKSNIWGVYFEHFSHDRVRSFYNSHDEHLIPFFSPAQEFLTRLVCNLLEEGNAVFRDREWEQAVREYSEGLNVACYAAAEELHIPEALLESLYVNRAAAYHSMVRDNWSCVFLRWCIIMQIFNNCFSECRCRSDRYF